MSHEVAEEVAEVKLLLGQGVRSVSPDRRPTRYGLAA